MVSVPPLVIGLSVSVGVVVVILVIWRIIKFSRRATGGSNPLPPVQMLAHDRQRLQEEHMRRSVHVSTERSHRLSLYPPSDSPSSSVTQIPDDRFLPSKRTILRSPYDLPSSSSASMVSLSNEGTADYEPFGDRRRSYHSTRPASVASSRPASVRGAPHHSRIDVVLPALLGTQQSQPTGNSNASHRSSLYDQWIPPLNRSTPRPRTSDSDHNSRPTRSTPGLGRRSLHIDTEGHRAPPVPPVPPKFLQASGGSPSS